MLYWRGAYEYLSGHWGLSRQRFLLEGTVAISSTTVKVDEITISHASKSLSLFFDKFICSYRIIVDERGTRFSSFSITCAGSERSPLIPAALPEFPSQPVHSTTHIWERYIHEKMQYLLRAIRQSRRTAQS